MDRGLYLRAKSLGVQKEYYLEYETPDYITIKIAIPGENNVDNIKIKIENETIKVNYSGNSFTEEFFYYYRINVPIIMKDTFAELEDGVLVIKIKKNLHN